MYNPSITYILNAQNTDIYARQVNTNFIINFSSIFLFNIPCEWVFVIKFHMIKDILQIGDPILTTKTTDVKDIESPETKSLIQDLLDTCEKNADISAGLASPQIGISKSVCVCRRVDLEEKYPDKIFERDELWLVLINPKIIRSSSEQSTEWEACLSIGKGKDNLWGPVNRAKKVTIEYTTPEGGSKTLKSDGYFSHVIQHEIDHLNGVLFVSYITNPLNIWRLEDLNSYIKFNDSYPEIQ